MLLFAHPWMFALLLLPPLVSKLWPRPADSSPAVRVPFGDRIKAAEARGQAEQPVTPRRAQRVVSALAWLFVVTALAKPQRLEPPVVKTLPTRDLLLLVDLSRSMSAEDFQGADGKPIDRLEVVEEVVGDFLVQRQGDRVGLVVFGSAPFLQAPFSTDLELARSLLDETEVGMAGPRTAFGDAIGLGISLFDESDVPAKTIIALTDGNDTASQVPPVEAARVAKERGIRIHTVAIGDPSTVGEDELDEVALREVAETAGGSYFFAADREALAGIYAELDRIETREIQEVGYRPRRELFFLPLLAALLIALTSKAIGLVRAARSAAPIRARAEVRVDRVTGKLEVRS